MKRIGLVMLLFSSLIAEGASATLLDFSTTSSVLSCGSAANCSPGTGNVINFGLSTGGPSTLQITYSANIENDLNVDPVSSANFGQMFLLCVTCSGQTGTFDLTGATLALNVAQGPDPFSDSGSFGVGAVSGLLTLTNGNFGGVGRVGWAGPASFGLSDGLLDATYTLQQPSPPIPPAYLLSINDATTFQGLIEVAQVPEPGPSGLLGLGIAALAVTSRRRSRR